MQWTRIFAKYLFLSHLCFFIHRISNAGLYLNSEKKPLLKSEAN